MWSLFARDTAKEFPYEIIETYPNDDGICTFCKGQRKADKLNVTILTYDKKQGNDRRFEAMKNYLRRLKTLRHPGIVTYLDSFENDEVMYIITETVKPLQIILEKLTDSDVKEMYIPWGILNIMTAVSFLNDDARLRHNGISLASVYVTEAGEWKLAELGYVTELDGGFPTKDASLRKYDPPEIDNYRRSSNENWSYDSWGLGILIWEVYNGQMVNPKNLRSVRKIPSNLRGVYSEMVAAKPECRPSAAGVVKRCTEPDGYFGNIFIKTLIFLEEIHLKNKEEVNIFFKDIIPILEKIPENVCHYKILPLIQRAYEYGNEGVFLLPALLKVSENLNETDYHKTVVPFIVKLISSNDRATRCMLLRNMERFIDKFPSSVINDVLFPLLVNGFVDANVRIREETVKAMVHIIPKLNRKNVDEEVLKHLARLQTKDDQGSVRTNCTVCLGKVAFCLHPSNRSSILTSAFLRALSDPYAPVRNAGVSALANCEQYFLLEAVSKKILPALCPLTLDSASFVRECTFKTIHVFLRKLKSVSDNPSLKEQLEKEALTANETSVSSWTDWAVTAITTRLSVKSPETNVQEETSPKPSDSIRKRSNEKSPSIDIQKNDDTFIKPNDEPPSNLNDSPPTTPVDESSGWEDEAWLSLSDTEQT